MVTTEQGLLSIPKVLFEPGTLPLFGRDSEPRRPGVIVPDWLQERGTLPALHPDKEENAHVQQ